MTIQAPGDHFAVPLGLAGLRWHARMERIKTTTPVLKPHSYGAAPAVVNINRVPAHTKGAALWI